MNTKVKNWFMHGWLVRQGDNYPVFFDKIPFVSPNMYSQIWVLWPPSHHQVTPGKLWRTANNEFRLQIEIIAPQAAFARVAKWLSRAHRLRWRPNRLIKGKTFNGHYIDCLELEIVQPPNGYVIHMAQAPVVQMIEQLFLRSYENAQGEILYASSAEHDLDRLIHGYSS